MKARFLKGVALGSAVSLATLAATAAFAGTGVGKVFNLGQENRVNARSQLDGSTPSAVLNLTNSDQSATASGMSIDVPGNDPPLVVNSSTKVKNLNSDLLDGHDASEFQRSTSTTCPKDSAISSVAPDGSTACNSSMVLPLEQNAAPGQQIPAAALFAPSTIKLGFYCVGTYEGIEVSDRGRAELARNAQLLLWREPQDTVRRHPRLLHHTRRLGNRRLHSESDCRPAHLHR